MKKTLISTMLFLTTLCVFNVKAQTIPITLNVSSANPAQETITDNGGGSYTINTLGTDPNTTSTTLTTSYDKSVVYKISFDYIATAGLDDVEIFFGPPIQGGYSAQGGALSATSVFKTFTLDMRSVATWTTASVPNGFTQFRFDLGRSAGQTITIKNIKLSSATLPITLSSFTGATENDGVKLNWTTASEKNNKSFIILRAGEDKVFTQIGNLAGAGNNDSKKVYVFRDASPLSGNNYYKLLQTDFNGNSEEFGPVVVLTNLSKESFTIYASPDKNEVKVTLTSLVDNQANITIFDTKGSKLANQDFNVQKGFNDIRVPVRDMKADIYVITLTFEGKTISKKFIK